MYALRLVYFHSFPNSPFCFASQGSWCITLAKTSHSFKMPSDQVSPPRPHSPNNVLMLGHRFEPESHPIHEHTRPDHQVWSLDCVIKRRMSDRVAEQRCIGIVTNLTIGFVFLYSISHPPASSRYLPRLARFHGQPTRISHDGHILLIHFFVALACTLYHIHQISI